MIADLPSRGLATVAAIVLALAAILLAPREEPRAAEDGTAEGRARAARAWAEVDASLARLDAGLAALDAKIAAALGGARGCPSSRDHEAARAKLREVKRQREEALRRRVLIDAACIENPLARGCM